MWQPRLRETLSWTISIGRQRPHYPFAGPWSYPHARFIPTSYTLATDSCHMAGVIKVDICGANCWFDIVPPGETVSLGDCMLEKLEKSGGLDEDALSCAAAFAWSWGSPKDVRQFLYYVSI